MSTTLKKFTDIILLILFIGALATTFTAGNVHEILGLLFVFFVILHNFANKNFYRTLGKGTTARKINQVCVFIFAVSIIVLIISGVVLWDILKINGDFNWRSIHLGAAIFAFAMMTIHLLLNARRYVKGKIFFAASIISIILIAAGIFGLPYLDRWFHKVEVDRAEIIHGDKVPLGKVLTVYFSRVGNTDFPPDVDAVSGASIMRDKNELIGNAQMIALMAQNATDSDLIEITTEKKYPAVYSNATQIARDEFSTNELPKLNFNFNIDAYDKIILVYPLWWGTLPKPVESFLKSYNLSGKILIPIVTHGGGGIGDSVDVLKSVTDAQVTSPLDIYSSDIPSSRKTISDFLAEQKF